MTTSIPYLFPILTPTKLQISAIYQDFCLKVASNSLTSGQQDPNRLDLVKHQKIDHFNGAICFIPLFIRSIPNLELESLAPCHQISPAFVCCIKTATELRGCFSQPSIDQHFKSSLIVNFCREWLRTLRCKALQRYRNDNKGTARTHRNKRLQHPNSFGKEKEGGCPEDLGTKSSL